MSDLLQFEGSSEEEAESADNLEASPQTQVAEETHDEVEEQVASRGEESKKLIEAALYVAGYPLPLKTLASITRIYSKRKVQELARSLTEEYNNKDGALEILETEDGKFVMQLKHKFVHRVRRLSMRPLLSEGPLKTLSYIALRQPLAQAKLILIRGGQAYDHVSRLLEMGLISREKFGKSHLLRTTERFSDYFGFSKENRLMKKQLEVVLANIEKEAKKRKKKTSKEGENVEEEKKVEDKAEGETPEAEDSD
jgi:segregation and condensation protein B